MTRNIFYFDTETWLVSPGRLAPRIVCVTYAVNGGGVRLVLREEGLDVLAAELAREGADAPVFVGHNVAYDFGCVVQARPALFPHVFRAYRDDRVYDTMIVDQLRSIAEGWTQLDPETRKPPKFSLEACVKRYFGEDVVGKHGEDAWRLRYHELDDVPLDRWPEAARVYPINDTELTRRVALRQQALDRPERFLVDLPRQCRAAWGLQLTSAWGLRTDGAAVEALATSLQQAIGATRDELLLAGVLKADGGRSMKVIQERVWRAYRENPPTTETGKPRTDADTLAQSGDPLLEKLGSISEDEKLLSTYLPVLRAGARRPLNSGYGLKATGRTSAYKPNVQNVPRKGGVRECFVPRAGFVFVDADYHVAELCALAQVLRDRYGRSAMADALCSGRELHLETAAGILGISYEEVLERHRAKDKAVKEARQLAKAANFGFPGGLGAENFVEFARLTYGLKLTVDGAKSLKAQWLARYPEMASYYDDVARAVSAGGGSFTATQPRSGRLRAGVGFCDGCNTYFQGAVADGGKAAVFAVAEECYAVETSPLYGCRIVAFIHDELLLEAPVDADGGYRRARAAAKRLAEVMVASMKVFTPDIPCKADAHLMRRWYKDAEPTFDANGELVPWEPEVAA